MGLSFTPGLAQWDYTGYEIFRRRLAALDGIDLKAMPGYDPRSRLDWDDFPSPLEELFRSSSVHGYWRAGQCRRMLPKLRAVRDQWAAQADPDRRLAYDLAQLGPLIAGMEHCAEHGCAMVWG